MNYLLGALTLGLAVVAYRLKRDRDWWRDTARIAIRSRDRYERERDDLRVQLEMANQHIDVVYRIWDRQNEEKWTEAN